MKSVDQKVLRFSVRAVESRIQFEIADTGPGISPDLLPKIFEPFVTHGKRDGTGLGLAITKSVVSAHQGTIEVSSSPKGTIFIVNLPLTGEAAPPA
jgi:signal transduction histidine kinase